MSSTTYDLERAIEGALAEGGIRLDARGFVSLLREAVRAIGGEPLPEDPAGQLTTAEAAELRRGGLAPVPDEDVVTRVRARTASELAILLSRALTTAETAARLGVDPSRVRQLLAERRLLGVRQGGEWRVLDLQFTDHGLVPNIGTVLTALPEGIPLLVAASWLRTPEPDLRIAGAAVTPVEWLTAGGDPARATQLAADL